MASVAKENVMRLCLKEIGDRAKSIGDRER